MSDLFSKQASSYARHRPHYPPELFAFLAAQAPGRTLAWDAATGSGQAAVALAAHFKQVHATDASARQLEFAQPHCCVRYAVEPAERCGLPDGSADLASCFQALHWLDLDAYYGEVRRVLRPGGLFAALAYGFGVCPSEPVNRAFERFRRETLKDDWAPQAWHVLNGYAELPFPFEPVAAPAFEMREDWSLEDFLGYLRSWSAVQTHKDRTGTDPLESLQRELRPSWDGEAKLPFRWALTLKLGRL